MTTVSAKGVLKSRHALDPTKEIATLLLRYPHCIHAEFMTHRMFSRNASSSRAIPVEKLIKDVMDDPFIPSFWGKNQKGMQAREECAELVPIVLTDKPSRDVDPCYFVVKEARVDRETAWLDARDAAVRCARAFAEAGYHKQIVNRLLEPFSHITVVATASNWSNFLHLRDHPDAEPHIAMLAREVRKALDEAPVQVLEPGQWHLPMVSDTKDVSLARDYATEGSGGNVHSEYLRECLLKLSVARCASTSYKTVDGFDMTVERAVALHDKLVGMDPLHASPCEHQAMADYQEVESVDYFDQPVDFQWSNPRMGGNLGEGWVQYRKMLAGECR